MFPLPCRNVSEESEQQVNHRDSNDSEDDTSEDGEVRSVWLGHSVLRATRHPRSWVPDPAYVAMTTFESLYWKPSLSLSSTGAKLAVL
jgi:hypothetical protein